MMTTKKAVREKAHLFRSAVVLGVLALTFLTGCHTTAGFGQDMQSTGRNLSNSANKANK
jgi:predicted small secreted protein